jgi:TonB family protein
MKTRRRHALVPVVLALSVAGTAVDAADGTDLLKKPISPGSVALLVTRASESGVVERWREAVRDTRPEVRAAAARVANVAGVASLAPSLLDALRAEADPSAAVEEMRAIAALGGSAADGALIEAAKHDPRFADLLATTLARARGAAARVHLPALRELGLASAGFASFLKSMYQVDPGLLDALGSLAIRDGDGRAWAALLGSAREAGQEPGAAILQASLTSSSPAVRAATYWHLLSTSGSPSADLERSLEATPEALGKADDPASTFALELLRRRSGRPAIHRAEWMEMLGTAAGRERLPWEIREPGILKLLDKAERATLSTALTGKPDGLRDAERRPPFPPSRGRPTKSGPGGWDSMRMPSGYPPGFVRDLLAVTKCKGDASSLGGGVVEYRRDGRPKTVSFFKPESACPDLVRTLVLTALSPPRVHPEHTAVLVVPLADDVLACMADEEAPGGEGTAEAPSPLSAPARAEGAVQAPKKVRNVNPVYPEAARRSRIQGQVVLEATISPTGCIRELAVLRSIPALDLAAFAAVSRWRYTPALLRGVPVPVIMTVDVNFVLH